MPSSGSAPPVSPRSFAALILPGLLLAATGVGAGDLLTAGFAGRRLGMNLLWAVIIGAILKWILTEGLARWQAATGMTLLEGWVHRLGKWIRPVFLIYLVIWSLWVGGALAGACGDAADAIFRLGPSRSVSKPLWGILHCLAAFLLLRLGNFRGFERIMSGLIIMMFITVPLAALLSRPHWGTVLEGIMIPRVPDQGGAYVAGIIGGVGGTLTILSYGYWIRDSGRSGSAGLRASRLDLAFAYGATALFGMAMIILSSASAVGTPTVSKDALAGSLADFTGTLFPGGRWIFLLGFWAAVFSSLLGVLQSVPLIFADFTGAGRPREQAASDESPTTNAPPPRPVSMGTLTGSTSYKYYLFGLAFIPPLLLIFPLEMVQLTYAVLGAFFMPLLALTLLLMNNRREWVGELRNGIITNTALGLTMAFFLFLAIDRIRRLLSV